MVAQNTPTLGTQTNFEFYVFIRFIGMRKLIGGWEGGLNKNQKGGGPITELD